MECCAPLARAALASRDIGAARQVQRALAQRRRSLSSRRTPQLHHIVVGARQLEAAFEWL